MDPQSYAAFGRIQLFLSDLQLVLGGLANSPFYGYGPMPISRGKPTQRSRAWMEKRRTAPMQPSQTTCTTQERFSVQTSPPDKASKGHQQPPTQDATALPTTAVSRPRSLDRYLPLRFPAAPRPWPTRIRVHNPRAYMSNPSPLRQCISPKIHYKQHVSRIPAQTPFDPFQNGRLFANRNVSEHQNLCYRDQPPNMSDVGEIQDQDECSNQFHSDQAESEVEANSDVKAESDFEVDVGSQNQTLFGFPPVLVPAYLPGNDEFDRLDATSSDQEDNHDDANQTLYSDYHDHSNCEDNENFTELSNDLEQPETIEYTDNHDNTVYNNENPAEPDAYHDDPGEDCEEQMGDNEDGGYEGDAGDHDCYDDGGYEAYQEEEYYGDYVCDEGGGYEAYQEEENYDYYDTF